jgi:diguanylate cyclase (GGDEF)-like protein/PAS domain S-box-containing protein
MLLELYQHEGVFQMDGLSEILGNFAIVIISTFIWASCRHRLAKLGPLVSSCALGLIMAVGTAFVMALPFESNPGMLLDLRYPLISIAGYFGGPVALVLPTITAIALRLMSGGSGVWIGVPQIAASAAVGLAAHCTVRGRIPDVRSMLLFSCAVTVCGTVGFFVAVPMPRWPTMLQGLVGPFAALLFASSFIAAQAISHEMRRQKATSENRMFRAVIEALPDCLNAKDTDGSFLLANPATARLMGASNVAALIGRSDFDFYSRSTAEDFRDAETEFLVNGVPVTREQRMEGPNGKDFWLSTLKAPLRSEDGRLIGIITHNREITVQKRMESQLAQSQRRLADAISSMADGFAMFDSDGKQVLSNARYLDLFPKTKDARADGTSLRCVIRIAIERGEELAVIGDIENVVERTYAALTSPGDRQMRLADGRWINARTRATGEGGCLIVYSDITSSKEAETRLRSLNEQLENMALRDGLTGLLNRRAFDRELGAAVDTATKGSGGFSLLMIDVDHFKKFNDTYGHHAGDSCLKAISGSIESTLLPFKGSLVARYGGEEIAVILPHAGEVEANAIASIVVSSVRALEIPHAGSDKCMVTVSIGAASWPTYGCISSAGILIEADLQLYAAKADGRDCARSSETSTRSARTA